MILETPTPCNQNDVTKSIALMSSHQLGVDYQQSSSLVATVIRPDDLTVRPVITILFPYDDHVPITYSLMLFFKGKFHIAIESKYRELLSYYLRSVLDDKDVTVESTKTKFTELFV